jgi:preprotein translocase subunit SecA
LKEYSDAKRKNEHSLPDLIKLAVGMKLNCKSKKLLANVERKVKRIEKLLESDYTINFPIKIELFKTKLSQQFSTWKAKKPSHWEELKSFEDPIIETTVALLYRGVQLHWNSNKVELFEAKEATAPRNAQLVALLLLISGKEEGGKFGEIETGEGKSCIVAMFAAFCALFRARVHVITSNRYFYF